jgi:5'-3' exoribonuclease 2
MYVTLKNSGYDFIKGLYENKIDFNDEVNVSIDGMQGTVLLAEDCVTPGG